jgi:transcriptional regulator with XRE-family HTH domain
VKVGDYLKGVRLDKGWSVRDAAKRLGVSATRLEEVEVGISRTTGKKTIPGLEVLSKAAKGYDVSIGLLMEMSNMTGMSPDEQQEAEIIGLWRSMTDVNRNMAIAVLCTIKAQEHVDKDR